MRLFYRSFAAFLAIILATSMAMAQPKTMSAPDAFDAVKKGELIILDTRDPGEWAESGVATGAWPVTMHAQDFGANLQSILSTHPNSPLALICATGGRSNYVVSVLEKNGIHGVVDIAEGMFGNGNAPGWIARGLPISDMETAVANFGNLK